MKSKFAACLGLLLCSAALTLAGDSTLTLCFEGQCLECTAVDAGPIGFPGGGGGRPFDAGSGFGNGG